jgi:hypothetical protein
MPASAPPSPVRSFTRSRPSRQGGWIGLVVLLLAVLIVGFLAKDALMKYLGPAQTVQRAGPNTPLDPASGDVTAAQPSTGNAMDRARGLQDMMQKESEKRGADQ